MKKKKVICIGEALIDRIRNKSNQGFTDFLGGAPANVACALRKLELKACPSAGACGGQFTANTMACVSEAIGLALPYSAGTPAPYTQRDSYALKSGKAVMSLLEKKISFFSHNSFNLISFFDKDHGERDGSSLINWVNKNLKENNIFMNKQSFWIYKTLKRKGFIAGKYEICHD